MSLILRHPEGVQRLTDVTRQFQREVEEDFKPNYDQHRLLRDPPAFEECRKGMKSGAVYEAQTAHLPEDQESIRLVSAQLLPYRVRSG